MGQAVSRQANFGVALERPFAVDLVDESVHSAQARVDLGSQRAEILRRRLGVAGHGLGVGEVAPGQSDVGESSQRRGDVEMLGAQDSLPDGEGLSRRSLHYNGNPASKAFLTGQLLNDYSLGAACLPLALSLWAALRFEPVYSYAATLLLALFIVTVTGLILAAQNATGDWASWAYAWTLVLPGGAGLGLFLQGLRVHDPKQLRLGRNLMFWSALMFMIGFVIFESIFNISGQDFGIVSRAALPVLLIIIGVTLLARSVQRGRSA